MPPGRGIARRAPARSAAEAAPPAAPASSPLNAFVRALATIMPPATPAAVASAPCRKPPPRGCIIRRPRDRPASGRRLAVTATRRVAALRATEGLAAWAPARPHGVPPAPGRCSGPRAAAEDARQEAAAALAALRDLGAQRFELGVQVGEGLFLDEDGLRHRVGRVGLLAQPLGDEALGLRVARLMGDALQATEDIGNDLAFLIVHDPKSPCGPRSGPSI